MQLRPRVIKEKQPSFSLKIKKQKKKSSSLNILDSFFTQVKFEVLKLLKNSRKKSPLCSGKIPFPSDLTKILTKKFKLSNIFSQSESFEKYLIKVRYFNEHDFVNIVANSLQFKIKKPSKIKYLTPEQTLSEIYSLPTFHYRFFLQKQKKNL